ncbi:MAG: SLBB domain-containing protein [Paludibacter sp.]
MKRLKFTLLSLIIISNLIGQDLSKLNPKQLEAYKKYSSGGGSTAPSLNNQDNTKDENRTLVTDDAQKPYANEKKTTKTTTTTTTLLNVQKPNTKDKKKSSNSKNENAEEDEQTTTTIVTTTVENGDKNKGVVFGSQLFNKQNLTFEPKLNIPTPVNYILGASDELVIDISGLYEANYKLKVSPDGTIRIPNVGPIKVSGLTIENATRNIRNDVSRIYSGITSGETHLNVTLGNIRSIRVTVIGEAVRPGSYSLPSLATVFNALYACGGPDSVGSMRDIKVVRANKIIANLDVYRFLMDGVLSNNITLQEGDVIKIEPYRIRTYINGAIKHNGIFETLKGETLQNLINFAGGYTDKAFKEIVTIFRLTDKGKTVIDVSEKKISSFLMQTGDSCEVSYTKNKFDNRVDINGSVYRPGAYALESGLTLTQLIAKADGLKEDAYMNMGYIIRKNENQIPKFLSFNLGKILKGTASDITLQKDDSVTINSLFDYREEQFVTITGAVKEPGQFPLVENTTLKDLIFQAKGFLEMASTDSVELIRVIKDQNILRNTNNKTVVMKFAMDKDLNFTNGSSNILLEKDDQVIIRTISGFEGIRMVTVDGEVVMPGNYNITSKAEKISDIIKRAGGFTKYAYPLGAFLLRSEKVNDVEKKLQRIIAENAKKQVQNKNDNTMDLSLMKATAGNPMLQQSYSNVDSIQNKMSGTKVVNEIFKSDGVVGINLKEIMDSPGSKYDLNLEENDVLFIPRQLQTIRVIGEVLFPTYVRYDKSMSFRDYVSNAGGFSDRAQKSSAFVLYANGTAKSTYNFLGIKFYPKVKPGARIVIPEKPIDIKSKLSPVETVSILSSIMTVSTLVYSIIKK